MALLDFFRLDNHSFIIDLFALGGVCASTLLFAIKHAAHGYEDDFGFHFDFVDPS